MLLLALAIELRPDRTELHPFLRTDVAAGDALADDMVDWRKVPAGLLPHTEIDGGTVAVASQAGEPLLPSTVTSGPTFPAGWWSVPVRLPGEVPIGTPVRLVETDSGTVVEGIVAANAPRDPLAVDASGLVAVPGDLAARVATASARDGVIVLLGAGPPGS